MIRPASGFLGGSGNAIGQVTGRGTDPLVTSRRPKSKFRLITDEVHRYNAMAAAKAINVARLALRGDGKNFVSLDKVIKTMRETGHDMKTKHKETARGRLTVNVIECYAELVNPNKLEVEWNYE